MTRHVDHDLEIARLRALLAEAGIDDRERGRSEAVDALRAAQSEIEHLRRENARLKQEAARTAGNYRLALSFGQAKLARTEAEIDHFEAILQSAIDFAIIVTDLQGFITTWNAGATRILGWREEEIEGQHSRVIFTEADRIRGIPEREMAKALAENRADDERWHMRRDGSRFFANGTLMPLRADDGETFGFLKILRDETTRRLAEEQLRASEAFSRSILAASPDCIKVLDRAGRVVAVNDNGLALLELETMHPLQAKPWTEFWPEDRAAAEQAVAAAWAGGTGRLQARCPTFRGTMKWWDCVITRIDGEDPAAVPRLLVVSRDATASKASELRIAETAARLRAVLDTIPIGLLIADASGAVIEGNQRVAEILKREPESLANEPWDACHEDQRPARPDEIPLRRVLDAGEAHPVLEVDYGKGDGSRGWVRFEAAPIRNPSAHVTGVVVTISDIDARKKAESQQRVLMHELSHRVKNILAVVVSITRQTLRNVKTIDAASTALLSRINALASAHDVLMQQQWASADLKALVVGAMRLQDGTGHQVAIDGPDLRLGPQAALSIALVLHELGTNAVKYGALSCAVGRVDIVWSRAEAEEPRLVFQWRESGGPPVSEPEQTGFGSRLIRHSLSSFGAVTMAYAPNGFTLDFEAPMKRIQQVDPT